MLPHLSLKVSFKSAAAIHHCGQKHEKKSNSIYKQVKLQLTVFFASIITALKSTVFWNIFEWTDWKEAPRRVRIEGKSFLKTHWFYCSLYYALFFYFWPTVHTSFVYILHMNANIVVLQRRLGAVLTSDLFGKYNFREHDWKDKVCTKWMDNEMNA